MSRVKMNLIPRMIGVLVLWLPIASASGGTFQIVQVTNDYINDGVVNLFGTRTYDILLDSDPGEFILSQQINLRLTSGKIIHHPFGSLTPPSPALIGAFPALAFDTFVAAGSATSSGANPTVVATSDMLGHPGSTPAIATDTVFDVLWGPQLGQDTSGQENFLSTRFTLSGDAKGALSYRVSFGGGPASIMNLPICGGYVGEGCGPEIVDSAVSATVPEVVAHMFEMEFSPGRPVVWDGFSFAGPGKVVTDAIDPTFDPETQQFVWPTAGWKPGTYTASVTVEGLELFDTGTLTIQLAVPEPGFIPLISSALLVFGVCRLNFRSRHWP